jgi:Na+/proline symporter
MGLFVNPFFQLFFVAIFGRSTPDATAVLRLPTDGLASFCEVLCSCFGGLLGLGVLDFVEFHGCYLLLFSFVVIIIAQKGRFVNPFFILSNQQFSGLPEDELRSTPQSC